MHKNSLYLLFLVLLSCGGDNGKNENPQTPRGTETIIINHDNIDRSALVYTPNGYDSSFALPVVLNFHGFGGNASRHLAETEMTAVADSAQFLLVYPQGTLLDGSPHWNNALPGPDNKSDAEDLGFVSELLAYLDSAYMIDRERIYACGYSNGGMMSYALACYLSNEIAAVASISGCLTDTSNTCMPSHPTAVLSFHGTNDGVLSYTGGTEVLSQMDALTFWAEVNNCAATATVEPLSSNSYNLEHHAHLDGDSSVVSEHYKVIGGGHTWFHFELDGKSANWLLWEFFDEFDIYGKR